MTNQNNGGVMGFAERLIRHFQKNGFVDVTEAVVLHVKARKNLAASYEVVSQEFARANAQGSSVSLSQFFEVRFIECFSETRTEDAIRGQFHADFEPELRKNFPDLYFGKTNYLFDQNAVGTKYDIAIRIGRTNESGAKIVLLNDPGSSFVEYFEKQMKAVEEWGDLCSDLKATVGKLALLQI